MKHSFYTFLYLCLLFTVSFNAQLYSQSLQEDIEVLLSGHYNNDMNLYKQYASSFNYSDNPVDDARLTLKRQKSWSIILGTISLAALGSGLYYSLDVKSKMAKQKSLQHRYRNAHENFSFYKQQYDDLHKEIEKSESRQLLCFPAAGTLAFLVIHLNLVR